jgi:hypothetical protein
MKRAELAWTRWVAWALWILGPVVFIGCLLTTLSNYFPYKPVVDKSGFVRPSPSVLDEVFRFCITGGWLIPLPFAITAIIVTVIGKLGDRTKVQRVLKVVLKVVLWGIIGLAVGLALLYLFFIATHHGWYDIGR